jgi:hypothetical protein
LARLPDGRLLLSTTGDFDVPDVMGQDRDVVAFDETAGTWELYFVGAANSMDSIDEDIDALALTNTALTLLQFSTVGDFSVPGIAGTADDAFAFLADDVTAESSGRFIPALTLDGTAIELTGMNGLHIARTIPGGKRDYKTSTDVANPLDSNPPAAGGAPIVIDRSSQTVLLDVVPEHHLNDAALDLLATEQMQSPEGARGAVQETDDRAALASAFRLPSAALDSPHMDNSPSWWQFDSQSGGHDAWIRLMLADLEQTLDELLPS